MRAWWLAASRPGERTRSAFIWLKIGHPVLGDPGLWPEGACGVSAWPFPRQALHAQAIGFVHPMSGQALQGRSSPADGHGRFDRGVARVVWIAAVTTPCLGFGIVIGTILPRTSSSGEPAARGVRRIARRRGKLGAVNDAVDMAIFSVVFRSLDYHVETELQPNRFHASPNQWPRVGILYAATMNGHVVGTAAVEGLVEQGLGGVFGAGRVVA